MTRAFMIAFARFCTRGLAAALALWLAADIVLALRGGGEPGGWLVDLRSVAPMARWLVLGLGLCGLAALAAGLPAKRATSGDDADPSIHRGSRWGRCVVIAMVLPLLVTLLANTVDFYRLRSAGAIRAVPFPLTLGFAIGILAALGFACGGLSQRGDSRVRSAGAVRLAMGVAAWLVILAFAQMFLFGRTDYRRPADAIVVLGARAYADGRLSDALRDRIATGCELYLQGYAPLLILSGGPGDGAIHETEAMRRFALAAGVPAAAIRCDLDGLNTAATARNTAHMLDLPDGARAHLNRPGHRVLTVSHAYHLPRVKLAFQREGLLTYTVPARERYTLTKMPLLMAREVAAWWAYYLAPAGSLCE